MRCVPEGGGVVSIRWSFSVTVSDRTGIGESSHKEERQAGKREMKENTVELRGSLQVGTPIPIPMPISGGGAPREKVQK